MILFKTVNIKWSRKIRTITITFFLFLIIFFLKNKKLNIRSSIKEAHEFFVLDNHYIQNVKIVKKISFLSRPKILFFSFFFPNLADKTNLTNGWVKVDKNLALSKSIFFDIFLLYQVKVSDGSLFNNNIKNFFTNAKNIHNLVDIALINKKKKSTFHKINKKSVPLYIFIDIIKSNKLKKIIGIEGYDKNIIIIKKISQENDNINYFEDFNNEIKSRNEIIDLILNLFALYKRFKKKSTFFTFLKEFGWTYQSYSLWVKYDVQLVKHSITGLDVLYGDDARDPREGWKLIIHTIFYDEKYNQNYPAYLSIKRNCCFDEKYKKKELRLDKDGMFKILQVSDLHFSTGFGKCENSAPKSSLIGCKADLRTIKFIKHVIDFERPDFVVITGDTVYGERLPDSYTPLFKASSIFIDKKVPFALTMGNHDNLGSIDKEKIMKAVENLPYSYTERGPTNIDGVGNYLLSVKSFNSGLPALNLYFLDSHGYSKQKNQTYDWIKKSQLMHLKVEADKLKNKISHYPFFHLSLAFFHIPIPEYKIITNELVGKIRERVISPLHNSGTMESLIDLNVKVVSVGHDHCNDYCLLNSGKSKNQNIWLCYGGAAGEGGYGLSNNYSRRVRVFNINSKKGEILSWKRSENNPNVLFDKQILVTAGNAVFVNEKFQ